MSISVCLDLVMRNLMASSLGIRRQGRAHCHPLLSLCHPPWHRASIADSHSRSLRWNFSFDRMFRFSTLREVHRLQLPPPNHDSFGLSRAVRLPKLRGLQVGSTHRVCQEWVFCGCLYPVRNCFVFCCAKIVQATELVGRFCQEHQWRCC